MRCLLPIVATLFAMGCAASTPERQFVEDAAEALGGQSRVLAVRTLTLEGEGTHFNLGQDMTPGASGQTFTVTGLKRQVDLANRRVRTELTRTPAFAYFQGQASQRQIQGVDGAVGYNVAASGNAVRVPAGTADERRVDFYHHPVTLLSAALGAGATVSNLRERGAERLADVTTSDGSVVTLTVDSSALPVRIESRSAHPNLGDVILSAHFAEYQAIDGVELPARVTTKVDDFTVADLRFTRITVNGTVDDLAAPAAAASAPAPQPAAPNVVAESVAPGVWLLAGQSHHSALIELSDQLLLVDAPQSEARTLAVIARARELVPGKPLTTLIATHHHFDHTAGIRAALAEGMTIVTHAGNREFFEEMAARPHTIVPDALSRAPKPVSVETVDDERVIKDAVRTVAIYHVAGNPHSDTMVMVHVPAARVLIEVDAYSPGSPVQPYAANLVQEILRRKLAVDRVVPLHGTVVAFAELRNFER